MHGAAHTANAPPSRTREPRPRASCRSPAPTRRSGHGRSPMKASPNTTSTKPAMRSSRNWSLNIAPADERGTDAEEDEEGGEPEDERHAACDHAPRIPRLAELIGIDRRHGREVRGHERKHARREERDHPGEERDRDRRPAHPLMPQPSNRASSSSTRRSSSGSSCVGGRLGRRRSPTPRADEEADRDRPADERGEREQPGEEPEPAFRRLREHLGPELGDERVLDLLLRVAGGDPHADERLHPLGDGSVRLVERRLADRAHELGLEIGGVRRRGGRGTDGDERRAAAATASARIMSRAPPRSQPAASAGRRRRPPLRRTPRRLGPRGR